MEEAQRIYDHIKSGKVKPIYFLTGEEDYYIDKITNCFQNQLLTEEEKNFNQTVWYGADIKIEDIVSAARRYPIMAKKQLIIIREAQQLSRTIQKLIPYAENPVQTTVLVLCYRHSKGLSKKHGLYKAVQKNGVFFESKKLYENQVSIWISQTLKKNGYTITPKANMMLVENLGTNLNLIDKELEKLKLVLEEGNSITPEIVQDNIGISKDFNNFELKKAIVEKQIVKANQIIQYFAQNPKDNPLVLTISLLFTFFSQLFKYHGIEDKSRGHIARILGVNPYFVGEFSTAANNYSMKKVSVIIKHIKTADLQSKGVVSNTPSQEDILKELLVKIMC